MSKSIENAYARLGKRIRKHRQELGMSQQELGQHIELTRQSVNNIEYGRQRVLYHHIYAMAKVLKCKAVDLLDERHRGTI